MKSYYIIFPKILEIKVYLKLQNHIQWILHVSLITLILQITSLNLKLYCYWQVKLQFHYNIFFVFVMLQIQKLYYNELIKVKTTKSILMRIKGEPSHAEHKTDGLVQSSGCNRRCYSWRSYGQLSPRLTALLDRRPKSWRK